MLAEFLELGLGHPELSLQNLFVVLAESGRRSPVEIGAKRYRSCWGASNPSKSDRILSRTSKTSPVTFGPQIATGQS